jgi:hypothetical protein
MKGDDVIDNWKPLQRRKLPVDSDEQSCRYGHYNIQEECAGSFIEDVGRRSISERFGVL